MILLSDIHGNSYMIKLLCSDSIYENEKYILQLGDFGFIFDEQESEEENISLNYINRLLENNNKTLFTILGNHECWSRYLDMVTCFDWDFKTWKIRDSIYVIQPGEIVNLEGKTILCVGGADSIDKSWRLQYAQKYKEKIWWFEETISDNDMYNAYHNLEKYDNKVDYICTHCEPYTFMAKSQIVSNPLPTRSEMLLDGLLSVVEFKKWYGGHVHATCEIETGGKIIKSLGIDVIERI